MRGLSSRNLIISHHVGIIIIIIKKESQSEDNMESGILLKNAKIVIKTTALSDPIEYPLRKVL
jgi:hypothetical protein